VLEEHLRQTDIQRIMQEEMVRHRRGGCLHSLQF
jgi:hypothetical protein